MIEIEGIGITWGSEFALKDINLHVREKEFFVILGPTGAGKTLLLELIAGFYQPDAGVVKIRGHDVTRLPPERRRIGFVYQDYALFPHLSVRDNTAFGMRMRHPLRKRDVFNLGRAADTIREHRQAIDSRVDEAMDKLNITHLGHRKPLTLSGGEQQRVAIARAIAMNPPVMLLDEPLNALDARTKDMMRDELRRIHEEFALTTLYVTHDQAEAMMLADRIAVMMDGSVVQVGTPEEIFQSPASEEIAKFVGMENTFQGTVTGREDDLTIIKIDDEHTMEAVSKYNAGEQVRVLIRPEYITLAETSDHTSARNNYGGTIKRVVHMGPISKVELNCDGLYLAAFVTRRSVDDMALEAGMRLCASFKATSVHVIKHGVQI